MSDSVRPHRQQPTRLLCPKDSLGKNIGVGCHFLLQYNYICIYIYMCVCVYVYVYIHKLQNSKTTVFCSAVHDPVITHMNNDTFLSPNQEIQTHNYLSLCDIHYFYRSVTIPFFRLHYKVTTTNALSTIRREKKRNW